MASRLPKKKRRNSYQNCARSAGKYPANINKDMENLEQRVQKIEERNQKVELDKAWETSWTRKVLLMLFTYLAISLYLWAIDISRPWINAIVPTIGFMISTLTMPFFKRKWLKSMISKDAI